MTIAEESHTSSWLPFLFLSSDLILISCNEFHISSHLRVSFIRTFLDNGHEAYAEGR